VSEKEENHWMIVSTELTANLPVKHSERAGLKEGADVAVKVITAEETEQQKGR
jgi:hypothetical protein